LGIQEAIIGLTYPFTAKVEVTVVKSIYEKLNPNPIPIFNPIPPLILRDDNEAPILVRIKAAIIAAYRLWYSISNV
jgi:hypothetical protein